MNFTDRERKQSQDILDSALPATQDRVIKLAQETFDVEPEKGEGVTDGYASIVDDALR